MTKQEEIYNKHFSENMHESIRDAVYDAMDEYAKEFANFVLMDITNNIGIELGIASITVSKETLKNFKQSQSISETK